MHICAWTPKEKTRPSSSGPCNPCTGKIGDTDRRISRPPWPACLGKIVTSERMKLQSNLLSPNAQTCMNTPAQIHVGKCIQIIHTKMVILKSTAQPTDSFPVKTNMLIIQGHLQWSISDLGGKAPTLHGHVVRKCITSKQRY